jgi:hypothetical protein
MRTVMLVVLLVSTNGLNQQPPSKSPKAVVDVPFHTEGGPPRASSVDELWGLATIVVTGTIASDPEYVTMGHTTFTRYELEVSEIFKGPTALSHIAIQRPGGIIDRGTHLERHLNQNFPAFEKGEQYVLFLRQLPGDRYTPINEEFAFKNNNGALEPRGRGALALSLKGRPLAELLNSLRSKR